MFLKWRCFDGACVSVKLKYSLSLVHRHDYVASKQFTSSQRFTSAQSLLGKSKFIAVSELMDVGSGFLSDSGRNAIIELQMNNCVTYFEKVVDISSASRSRRNASGQYFDTSSFQLAEHRWFIRFYVSKLNASGLPAVYLYLADKTRASVVIQLQFVLRLAGDVTEILSYSFGEEAKFEGFGKTLCEPVQDAIERTTQITVGAEIQSVAIYKLVSVRLPHRAAAAYATHTKSQSMLFAARMHAATMNSGASATDSFQVENCRLKLRFARIVGGSVRRISTSSLTRSSFRKTLITLDTT